MAIKYYETYDKEHRHFGGLIFPSDYNFTASTTVKKRGIGSPVAQRIASDRRWEESLIKNFNFKNTGRKNRNLEDE